MYKYRGEWPASFEYNKLAAELNPDDKGSWWNLGIAATALGNWPEARRAWSACGITPPMGDGPPDFGWGLTPVRLDPNGHGEVVWARRIDPARAEIVSVPLPTSLHRWKDIVLDGAVEGQRISEGRVYSVFNALQLLLPSSFQTFVLELGTENEEAIERLGDMARESEIGAEYWGKSTQILCRACSLGFQTITYRTEPARHILISGWQPEMRRRYAHSSTDGWRALQRPMQSAFTVFHVLPNAPSSYPHPRQS